MDSQGAGAGTAAPPRRSMSRIPNVRLDHRMACDLRSRDSVSAVADVKDVTGPDQPHRRRLTSLLEPLPVELDLRPVEVTGAEADVRQRNPCRCERRICDTPPFSRSVRVRTGGVEPPQPMATRLQRAELAGARRPQEVVAAATPSGICPRRRFGSPRGVFRLCGIRLAARTGRPVGLEPTLRGSRPRMLAVTPRPPSDVGNPWFPTEENGRRVLLPATGGRDVARFAPEPAVLPFGSPASVITTPPPPHRLALEAYRPSRTLGPALCTALVPSLPRPTRR